MSAALEKRMKSVENRIRDLEGSISSVDRDIGAKGQRVVNLDAGIAASRERQRMAGANRAAAEKALPGVDALVGERLGEAGASKEALAQFVEELKRKEKEAKRLAKEKAA